MTETLQIPEQAPDVTTDVIREVCQQNKSEPGAIWAALEAKGVETTPGVVIQAMAEHPSADATPKPIEPGLMAEDLATLGTLATKAGGVEQLIRILSVWHDTPK